MTTTKSTDTETYRVEVVRSGNWWAITVPDLPGTFSQAKRLDQVEANAREAIALMVDGDEGQLDLDVRVNTDPTLLNSSPTSTRQPKPRRRPGPMRPRPGGESFVRFRSEDCRRETSALSSGCPINGLLKSWPRVNWSPAPIAGVRAPRRGLDFNPLPLRLMA